MEQKRLCPFCMGELPPAATVCPHCGKILEGCNPAGCLPVGTVLAGRYTVGEMRSLDGEGVLYSGVENLGGFRVAIKEYLPVTLSAERGADCILRPKQGSEVLFKTTRMDFADLYRAIQRVTPASGLEAVLDVVEANNTVYAVLENLGGTPLEQWLENRPAPVQAEDACAMLRPVFEGVAAMHKAGLVHRGICPENIRVMADGRCRLAGYAKPYLAKFVVVLSIWSARSLSSGAPQAAACTSSCTRATLRRSSTPPPSLRGATPMNTALPPSFTAWCADRRPCPPPSAWCRTLTLGHAP